MVFLNLILKKGFERDFEGKMNERGMKGGWIILEYLISFV